MMDAFSSFRAAEARRRAQDENGARLAWSFHKVSSTGWGEFDVADMLEFDVSFIEEPIPAHGYYVASSQLVDTRYPRAWGFVNEWNIVNGRYTGCWVSLIVETQGSEIATTVTTDPGYAINHFFTFAAVAMKDIPVDQLNIPPTTATFLG